jgi:hypothetical protein
MDYRRRRSHPPEFLNSMNDLADLDHTAGVVACDFVHLMERQANLGDISLDLPGSASIG